MCARIKIKLFVFRTVISRVQLCQISKGCRVSRHPSGVKDHPMNRIGKNYRGDCRQRKLYGIQDSLYRRRLTGYLWRDARVSRNATPWHYCNVFLPGGSYHSFPQSSFSPVRLQSSFARCRKQEACHGLQQLCNISGWRCRAFGYRLAADRAGEKYANVINRYHNVTS